MSDRDISALNIDALDASHIKAVLFVRMDFGNGVQRFHTEIGPRDAAHPVFGTETYLGIGTLGGLASDIVESVSAAPAAMRIALSGIDAALINTTITEDYFRRDVDVMIGFEAPDGSAIDDPVVLYSGLMDKVDIILNEGQAEIVLTAESRGTNLLGASDWRFTDEDKRAEVPGDTFGRFIYRMVDIVVKWGGGVVGGFGGSVQPSRDRPRVER